MKRTQIYIDDATYGELVKESKQKAVSVSEIIRDSIRHRTGNRVHKMLNAARDISGIWKARDIEADKYIRGLRKDRKVW